MRRFGATLVGLALLGACGGTEAAPSSTTQPATTVTTEASTTVAPTTPTASTTLPTPEPVTTAPNEPTTTTEPQPGERVWVFEGLWSPGEPGHDEADEWIDEGRSGVRGTGRSETLVPDEWGSRVWWEFEIDGASGWVPELYVLVEEEAPSGSFVVRSAPEPPGFLAADLNTVWAREKPGRIWVLRRAPSGEAVGPVFRAVRDREGVLHYGVGDAAAPVWFRAADLDPADGPVPGNRMFILEGWLTVNRSADGLEGAVRVVDAAGDGVPDAAVQVSVAFGEEVRDETIPTDDEGWARVTIDIRPASVGWTTMTVLSVSHPGLEFSLPSETDPDGATQLFGWMAGCCEPEYPLTGQFGGGATTLCPAGGAAEVREAWDPAAPVMAAIPAVGVAVPGGGVIDRSGRVWLHVELGERRGYVLASTVRTCDPDPTCAPGWVRPEPWAPLSREPFDALREYYGLEDGQTFVAETIRYFNGSSPFFGSEHLFGRRIGFWYIEGWLESDPSFRGRWIVADLPQDHAYGQQVVPFGFAPYESEGFEPGTWLTHEPGGGLIVDPFDPGQSPLWGPDTAGCLP